MSSKGLVHHDVDVENANPERVLGRPGGASLRNTNGSVGAQVAYNIGRQVRGLKGTQASWQLSRNIQTQSNHVSRTEDTAISRVHYQHPVNRSLTSLSPRDQPEGEVAGAATIHAMRDQHVQINIQFYLR